MPANLCSVQQATDRDGKPIRGKWRAKVSLGLDAKTGKYKQKSKTIRADSRREANRLGDEWAEALKGTVGTAGTVNGLAEAWMLRLAEKNKASTMRSYRTKLDLHILPVLGGLALLDLDRRTMDDWQIGITVEKVIDGEKTEVRASPRTRNQCIGIVRAMFNWGQKVGRLTDITFLKALELETADKGREPAAEADVRTLLPYLKTTDPELFAMVWIALTTGLRRGEILGLRTGDVDIDLKAVVVTHSLDRQDGLVDAKTKSSKRVVALDEATTGIIATLTEVRRQQFKAWTDVDAVMPGDRWLFPSPRDPEKPWSPDAVNKRLSRRVVECGLPIGAVTLHRLRHNMGTLAMDSGAPSKAISNRLGHESTEITEGIYIGRLSETDREIAEMMGRKALELGGL